MVSINVIGDIISGSLNGIPFGVTFSQELYDKMAVLAEKANTCSSVEELNKIIEEFKPLTVEDVKGHTESFSPYLYVDNKTGNYHLKHNNVISSVPLPSALVERIKYSIEKKIDINPLIKCWVRWLRNPFVKTKGTNFSERFFNFIDIKFTNSELINKLMEEKGYSEDVATKMATAYSVKVTNEGLIACYKVSEELTTRYKLDEKGEKVAYNVYSTGAKSIDPLSGLITYEKVELKNEDRLFRPAVQKDGGDAFYCEGANGFKDAGHYVRVGWVIRLPDWSYVNTDDYVSCKAGLHVGGLDYIRNYQNEGTCTHDVFIAPNHIGAIPDDSTGAIRGIQYFVATEFSGVNGSLYHSSKYAALTDEQWSKEREQIVKEFGELVDKDNQSIKEDNSLTL